MTDKRFLLFKITVPLTAAALTVILISGVLCKNSNPFVSSGTSPLRNDSSIVDAVKQQEIFRKVYEINKNSVVYISTEQTVKMPQHPFFDDPFFRQFFGPEMKQPRTRKRTGLGTGFIISEDGISVPTTMLSRELKK
jgi:S1-C subfamily serine protease